MTFEPGSYDVLRDGIRVSEDFTVIAGHTDVSLAQAQLAAKWGWKIVQVHPDGLVRVQRRAS